MSDAIKRVNVSSYKMALKFFESGIEEEETFEGICSV